MTHFPWSGYSSTLLSYNLDATVAHKQWLVLLPAKPPAAHMRRTVPANLFIPRGCRAFLPLLRES